MREIAGIVILVLLLAGLATGTYFIVQANPRTAVADDALNSTAELPPRGQGRVADSLHLWESTEDLNRGEAERVETTERGFIVLNDDRPESYPLRGAWTSQVIQTPGPFLELLPSWNVDTPAETGIRVDGRVQIDGEWSPWLDFGYWGKVPPPRTVERFHHGRVAIDILELKRPAEAYQLRVNFFHFGDGSEMPRMRRLAAVASGPAVGTEATTHPTTQPGAWSGVLEVPFIPQGDTGERLSGETCSPTSTTMVASFFGAEAGLMQNTSAIYDIEHGLFGNWNRAVARAGELGMKALLVRYDTLDEARRTLAEGKPIIISINFKRGQAPSFISEETPGHLIVLRGVTPEGDFVVNDPGSRAKGEAVVYKAADVETAWLNNAGGVAYLIEGPDPKLAPEN